MKLDRSLKTTMPAGVTAVMVLCGPLLSGTVQATSDYRDAVNSYCGASYSCSECHTSPSALNSTGQAFAASGHDPATICPPTTQPTCTDADGDGYAVEGGECGPVDCNDDIAAVNPGAVESCTNGTDDNCNGLIDTQDPAAVGCATTSTTCTDADGDGYAIEGGGCGPVDSNDSDPTVNPEATEDCSNGIDDNGNALIDGADPACAVCVPTARIEKQKRACTDGADNDCNGLVDCADPSCSSTRSCKPARKKHRHHHHEGDAYNANENDAEQERDDDND